ncbi:BREX-2 system adenine-specific DNA-methyltransferase PglX [Mobilicoccus sp.]|uniref:BREX-2 system adenine-specific DNA-methyltransferase PglX n=1 Tax=Mobilicoccus sp. TaxID=2034349 RepID=UPI0028A908C8|nr:BREX-2 system adenine-specific DNA-methyltransferase PglX [Mobilicoccus sp.]
MIDAAQLTTDLKRLVLTIENDLRARVDGPDRDLRQEGAEQAWRDEYDRAREAGRTARTWTEWRDDRVTQAAVAWVLTTVFVRFCEDNRLLEPVWISGPNERRQEAHDARTAYFQQHPLHTDREWLLQPIEHLRSVPATKDLVESHSALWTVAPSAKAAEAILAFWHEQDADGELRRDFTDPELSTRFLGDLYQDLSEHARDTYALLQTPEFVEEFILDRTLEPALKERPLEGFKLIDPTCGSGHFLLGAFNRFFTKWRDLEPNTNTTELAGRALGSIYGVDLNPFAVAIARFRLIIAALHACEAAALDNAPDWHLSLAVGDSLLHGHPQEQFDLGIEYDADAAASGFTYATEDLRALKAILQPQTYDAVVGNPPYITVKDKAAGARYKARYKTCHRQYALSVPFMERFFGLANGDQDGRPCGRIGTITSNSFMKREFGSKLIEEFLSRRDLTLVIDTSGAYIPGHGTPTVIIMGRNRAPSSAQVGAVLGIQGEPGRPEDAAKGRVWRSIVENFEATGHEDAYTSTVSLDRKVLAVHPWSLSGGGADSVIAIVNDQDARLSERHVIIGRTTHTGNDDCFFMPTASASTRRHQQTVPVVLGEDVRDYEIVSGNVTIFPYDDQGVPAAATTQTLHHLWRTRRALERQLDFGQTKHERGLRWIDHSMFFASRYRSPLSIAFAFVATHNHFVLDRGGKVFKQSAPVIKLPEGASEDEHLALLGVLNSSTACFWLKQNSYPKGGDPMGKDGARVSQQPWSDRYEFTGTTLQDFPLPSELPLARPRRLDEMARTLPTYLDAAVPESGRPHPPLIARMGKEEEEARCRMIALQEEMDWETYRLYGLLDEDLTLPESETLPEVALGERAFEIALARKIVAGQESSAWFERHSSKPVTEIPTHWPETYRALVQRRLDLIESDRFIGLLERPEYKRRWATEPWDKRVERALRGWLLDRLEGKHFWFDAAGRPRAMSVSALADEVARDEELRSTLALWAGQHDIDVAATLEKLLGTEHVPYLAAWRLKEPGLRKRREWERTWDLQRAEDSGEKVGDIPVPPKYTTADFRKTSYWSHRGKLDVPKERFISYPGGNRETDRSTLLGWAGWDHAQQSLALATIINARTAEGVSDERLTPLVAGMAELEPWVDQWHDEADANGINLAEFLRATLDDHLHRLSLTRAQLLDWAPPASPRGRRKKAT